MRIRVKELVAQALAAIDQISADDAMRFAKNGSYLIINVPEQRERARDGQYSGELPLPACWNFESTRRAHISRLAFAGRKSLLSTAQPIGALWSRCKPYTI
jgi:hypothetical protein